MNMGIERKNGTNAIKKLSKANFEYSSSMINILGTCLSALLSIKHGQTSLVAFQLQSCGLSLD